MGGFVRNHSSIWGSYMLSSDALADDTCVLVDEDLWLLSSLVDAPLGQLEESLVCELSSVVR